MINQLVALILEENKWLTLSLSLAALAVTILLYRRRHSDFPTQRRVAAALNLFFAVTIGTMAFGHLLAVTTKLVLGTLEGSIGVFYLIGIALAVPYWWLVYHAWGVIASDDHGRRTLILNAWLAITLLALGIHNLPLAAPALFNVAYQLHARRVVGWAIVSLAIVFHAGLFVGSLIFLASGQSFEQFSGIE